MASRIASVLLSTLAFFWGEKYSVSLLKNLPGGKKSPRRGERGPGLSIRSRFTPPPRPSVADVCRGVHPLLKRGERFATPAVRVIEIQCSCCRLHALFALPPSPR